MRVRTLLNPFNCFQRFEKKEWTEVFPNLTESLDVEIGCGSGSFLTHYALKNPTRSIIGFEIRTRLAHAIKEKISTDQIPNAHLFLGNGQIGLEDLFDDNSIDRIFVFHPDPWPKTAHHKRRVINESTLRLMQQKLKPQGQLYLSTDVPELWQAMLTTIDASKRFILDQDEQFWTTLYQTRWHEISQQRQKILSYATFKVVK